MAYSECTGLLMLFLFFSFFFDEVLLIFGFTACSFLFVCFADLIFHIVFATWACESRNLMNCKLLQNSCLVIFHYLLCIYTLQSLSIIISILMLVNNHLKSFINLLIIISII